LPKILDERVLVGTETHDDAGVYRLDAKRALVCTTDFFSPVVDDPYDYGRVAAANALSDVWAMGARPLVALNLVGFPGKALPLEVLHEILRGGADTVSNAGAVILGGHTVEDAEPKYGLAVVGEVHPKKVFTNVGARPGDKLILTKPLGSGIVTTAIKQGKATAAEIRHAVEVMATLNRASGEVLAKHTRSVRACTDVTGYGFLGHLREMLEGPIGARIDASAIPFLPAARRLVAAGVAPGGTRANLNAAAKDVRWAKALREEEHTQLLLADAQTSGGLLAAVSPRACPKLLDALRAVAPSEDWVCVAGEIVERPGPRSKRIEVVAN